MGDQSPGNTSVTVGSGPLDGIRVVEVGRYIAAPYAGRVLAELGADVVKVEAPEGDPMRHWEGARRAASPQFNAYNRNKRSASLDLKTSDGASALQSLCATADVLIENFRPGVMSRLHLSADDLLESNPRLIYCSITGFGSEGPYVGRPSYDTVVSAMSGLYSLVCQPQNPQPVGPAFSDLLSGMSAVQSILAALLHRSTTGRGQHVEISMLGATLGLLSEQITSVSESGQHIDPNTRQRRAQAYGCLASDQKAFVVHLSVPEKFWLALQQAMERQDWGTDDRFASRQARYENYRELSAEISKEAAKRTRNEWFERFERLGLPHAPLNAIEDLFLDPQVSSMAIFEDAPFDGEDPMLLVKHPATFSRCTLPAGRRAPHLGEHTQAILSELGSLQG